MKKALLILLAIVAFSCSEDDSSNNNSDVNDNSDKHEIEGRIILPDGSNLNYNELTVESFIDDSEINSEQYAIEIPKEEPSFTFVSDSNDKVILMGYNYPNKTNFDINAESTVISLALTLPISSILTDQAKIDFITKLKQNSNFPIVVENMEQLITQGISPLDTNQTAFLDNFLKLFESSISMERPGLNTDNSNEPVKIYKAGNKITFQNEGKAYETAIGIYKNDARIEYIELDRVQFFANSASEAINTGNNLITDNSMDITEKTYEFKTDGEYEVKISTGFGTDSSYESQEARFDNFTKWAMDFLFTIVPLKELNKPECLQTILSETRSYTVSALAGKKVVTLADALVLSYDISYSVVNLVEANLKCFSKNPANIKFFQFMKKVFGWTAWVSRTGTSLNISMGAYQWVADDSSMELCYQVNDNSINDCLDLDGTWALTEYTCDGTNLLNKFIFTNDQEATGCDGDCGIMTFDFPIWYEDFIFEIEGNIISYQYVAYSENGFYSCEDCEITHYEYTGNHSTVSNSTSFQQENSIFQGFNFDTWWTNCDGISNPEIIEISSNYISLKDGNSTIKLTKTSDKTNGIVNKNMGPMEYPKIIYVK